MAARIAWVLNLDADLELAAGARAYTPSAAVRHAVRIYAPIVAASLLAPDDIVVDESSAPGVAEGCVGRAFCPTPRAIALLERAGAEPEAYPPAPVLRAVNSRAFAAALGPTLPGAAFVGDLGAAVAKLAAPPPAAGNGWRIKRAFGMSGRGQRVVKAGTISGSDAAFVRAGIAKGGVQIEPNVTIAREYALHGVLAQDGSLELGSLVVQRCDPRGAWIETVPAERGEAPEIAGALQEEATRVGSALHAARYFGPFGIDAYTYLDERGESRLQPRSEINARFAMGFAVGFQVRELRERAHAAPSRSRSCRGSS